MCCKRDTSCGQESDVLEHMNSGFVLCDKGIICVAWLLDCLSDALKQVLSVISLHPVHAKDMHAFVESVTVKRNAWHMSAGI